MIAHPSPWQFCWVDLYRSSCKYTKEWERGCTSCVNPICFKAGKGTHPGICASWIHYNSSMIHRLYFIRDKKKKKNDTHTHTEREIYYLWYAILSFQIYPSRELAYLLRHLLYLRRVESCRKHEHLKFEFSKHPPKYFAFLPAIYGWIWGFVHKSALRQRLSQGPIIYRPHQGPIIGWVQNLICNKGRRLRYKVSDFWEVYLASIYKIYRRVIGKVLHTTTVYHLEYLSAGLG